MSHIWNYIYNGFISLSIAGKFLVWVITGSGTFIMIYIILSCSKGRHVSKLLPTVMYTAQPQGSFAMNLGMSLNKTSNSESVNHIDLYSLMTNHSTMIIVMSTLIIHLIVALWIIKRQSALIYRTLGQIGFVGKNSYSLHHFGEIALNACIILKCTSCISSKTVLREIAVQLCTLPRDPNEWYCKINGDPSTWIRSRQWYFWNNKAVADLLWGPICIKSIRDNELDTCQDLPNKLGIQVCEIRAQLDNYHLPVFCKYEFMNITKLYLQGPSYYRCIYSYSYQV